MAGDMVYLFIGTVGIMISPVYGALYQLNGEVKKIKGHLEIK